MELNSTNARVSPFTCDFFTKEFCFGNFLFNTKSSVLLGTSQVSISSFRHALTVVKCSYCYRTTSCFRSIACNEVTEVILNIHKCVCSTHVCMDDLTLISLNSTDVIKGCISSTVWCVCWPGHLYWHMISQDTLAVRNRFISKLASNVCTVMFVVRLHLSSKVRTICVVVILKLYWNLFPSRMYKLKQQSYPHFPICNFL